MSQPLLPRIAQGDTAAVNALMRRYEGLVWSLARRFSASDAEAEDAAQDVFVEVWRSAGRFDADTAKEVTFVAMIARRRLIDRMRRASRRPACVVLTDLGAAEGATERMEARGEAVLAGRVLRQLRPAQRNVLLLSTCHGMSHSEIAAKLEMPLGTVKAHARRALHSVRRQLAQAA